MFVRRPFSKQEGREELHSYTRAQGNKDIKTAVLLDVVSSSLVAICGRFGRPFCFLCVRKKTEPESGWSNFQTDFGK
jgi:hypothetical protein